MRRAIIILALSIPLIVNAQDTNNENTYVLIGTVVNGDNNTLLSAANIITSKNFGTKTNELGEFSVHTQKDDTLKISFVGYKTITYIAPDKKPGKYLIKFKMYRDSISLNEVEIFPYPTYEEFKAAFIAQDKQEEQIKIEGINTYVDVDNSYKSPSVFSPASFIYDRLFDKKAKTQRKIKRRNEKIKKSTQFKD